MTYAVLAPLGSRDEAPVQGDGTDQGARVSARGRKRRSPRISERVAEKVADAMFALSTPSRVLILGFLLDGPHTVSELTEALGMEQSAVSHQLRVLREHKLVRVEREGRTRVYALQDEHVVALLEEALRHVEQRGTGRVGSRVRRVLGGGGEVSES